MVAQQTRPGQDRDPIRPTRPDGAEADRGVVLEGRTGSPALLATRDFQLPIDHSDDEISSVQRAKGEVEIVRTELELILDLEATVGEVNNFLAEHEALIVSMNKAVPVLVIRFSDPGDLETLEALRSRMEKVNFVEAANLSYVVGDETSLDALPEHLDASNSTDISNINHQLAVRGHAAWNLRNEEAGSYSARPWLVIADSFGDGAPGDGYSGQYSNDDFANSNASGHGYHVLGIIAGKHKPPSSLADDLQAVTGIMPGGMQTRGIDTRTNDGNTWPRRRSSMISRMNEIVDLNPDARIIINTSLHGRGLSNREQQARAWILQVRLSQSSVGINPFSVAEIIRAVRTPGSGLESQFVHFTSAGNNSGPLVDTARDNSPITFAALGEISLFGNNIPNLENTLVVENRRNTNPNTDPNDPDRPRPACASPGSVMEGNLSAIGSSVFSFSHCASSGPDGCEQWAQDGTRRASGTSMATPQAAGTAAYAWSVNPNLSVTDLVGIMKDTAKDLPLPSSSGTSCNSTSPQPVIDAYAAVLTAGGQDARRTLLDVNETGSFDHQDIAAFLDAFEQQDVSSDNPLEYGRYDLNGSGISGGSHTERFDLNMDGAFSGGTERWIEGSDIQFDQSAVTDIEILCYYAYSDLYAGSSSARWNLLKGQCGVDERPDAEGISGYEIVTEEFTLNAGDFMRETVYCPNDKVVLSGGAQVVRSGTADFDTRIQESRPGTQGGRNLWLVAMSNQGNRARNVQIHAVCADEPPGYHIATEEVTLRASRFFRKGFFRQAVQCESGASVMGGGAGIIRSGASNFDTRIQESAPGQAGGRDIWLIAMGNESRTNRTAQIYATCALPPSGYEVNTTDISLEANGFEREVAPCPADKRVLGGGTQVVGHGSGNFNTRLQEAGIGSATIEGQRRSLWLGALGSQHNSDRNARKFVTCAEEAQSRLPFRPIIDLRSDMNLEIIP